MEFHLQPLSINCSEEPHDDLHHDPEVSKQLAEIEKEAEAIEVNSELERQGKVRIRSSAGH